MMSVALAVRSGSEFFVHAKPLGEYLCVHRTVGKPHLWTVTYIENGLAVIEGMTDNELRIAKPVLLELDFRGVRTKADAKNRLDLVRRVTKLKLQIKGGQRGDIPISPNYLGRRNRTHIGGLALEGT